MKKLLLVCLLTVQVFSLDVNDIKIMRDKDVLIAFPNEDKAHIIPKGMNPSRLMKVNYLNLNGMSIYSIPKWLPQMTNISRLELANTKLDIEDLKDLKPLKELDILNLSGTKLFKKSGDLVEILSHFKLNQLNLSNTGGGSSNYANIGKLSSLIKLDLSNNSISDINGLNLEKFKNLNLLSLKNNSLSGTLYTNKLPKSSLKELYLSGNSFSRFKFSGDFPMLRVLDISNNGQYMSFDEEFDDPYLFKSMDKNKGGQGKFNNDMVLPKSIMKRLGLSKWITPSKNICKQYNGYAYSDYDCKANWKEAESICRSIGGRLPTLEELVKVITECGLSPSDDYKETEKNYHYQSCYKAKGFSDSKFFFYWTSRTNSNNSQVAYVVRFLNAWILGNELKSFDNGVRCVRVGQ